MGKPFHNPVQVTVMGGAQKRSFNEELIAAERMQQIDTSEPTVTKLDRRFHGPTGDVLPSSPQSRKQTVYTPPSPSGTSHAEIAQSSGAGETNERRAIIGRKRQTKKRKLKPQGKANE